MRFEKFLINEAIKYRAEFLETSALLGVNASNKFIDLCRRIVDSNNRKLGQEQFIILINEFLQEIPNQITSGMDWNDRGISELKGLTIENTKDIVTVAHTALGMNNYINSVVDINNKFFIHGKIKEFYSAEKRSLGSLKGSKDNTADCVICSAPAEVVISSLLITQPEIDEKGGFFTLGNIKCYQVSLKKSESDAQLGKIASYMHNVLHVGKSGMASAETLVQESMWDTIKSAAYTIWDKFTTILDTVLSKMKGLLTSHLNRGVTKSDLNDIASVIGYTGPINESMVNYFNQPLLSEGRTNDDPEKINTLTQAIKQKTDKVLKMINDNLSVIEKIGSSKDDVVTIINIFNSVDREPTDKEVHDMVANYSISLTIMDFLTKIKDIGTTIRRVTAEMFFGDTKLPLWKVYGAYKKEKCWVYLGTVNSFMTEGQPDAIEIFGFKAIPNNTKTAYSMMMTTLDKITPDNKTFILFRADNNQGTKGFSANIEGTNDVKVPLNTTLRDVLVKYKV